MQPGDSSVLSDMGVSEQRERKLNMVVTVFIVIGMGLYGHLSIGKVLKQLVEGTTLHLA